jgi:hypothetical protein
MSTDEQRNNPYYAIMKDAVCKILAFEYFILCIFFFIRFIATFIVLKIIRNDGIDFSYVTKEDMIPHIVILIAMVISIKLVNYVGMRISK